MSEMPPLSTPEPEMPEAESAPQDAAPPAAESAAPPEEAAPQMPPEASSSPAEAAASPEMADSPRSRLRRLLRSGLTWLLGLFIVFAAGYLLAFFTTYQPLAQRFQAQQDELKAANQQIETLQSEIESLNSKISDLQERLQQRTDERDALQADVDAAALHFYVLRSLVDVQGARLALASEDADTAQVYLAKVPAYLDAMQPLAAEDAQETLSGMRQRLSLALDELAQDPPTAATDLAILADWLRQFESTLW